MRVPVLSRLSLALAFASCGSPSAGPTPRGDAQATSRAPEVPAGFSRLPERWLHSSGIVLVRIPAGHFRCGSPPEEPKRDTDEEPFEVTIDEDFWLGETEVTIGQWELLMGVDFDAPPRDPRLPIGDVTWYEAQEFLARLDAEGPAGWRLPTELEWEYACRAGTTGPFSFGPNIRVDQVNFDPFYPYGIAPRGEHSSGPLPVRSLPPNPWGLFEMHGNLIEWCSDVYGMRIGEGKGGEGAARVLRGGAWLSSADQVRSAYREGYPPSSDGPEYGFRVAWGGTTARRDGAKL